MLFRSLGDIELEREEAVGGVDGDEVCEHLWSACGRDGGVSVLEDDLGELAAEAGRCASDCRECQIGDYMRVKNHSLSQTVIGVVCTASGMML